MRKKLSAIALAAMLSLTCLAGCGSGKSVLVYNNAFAGGGETGSVSKDPPVGYYETLSYKVFSDEKNYAYKRDSAIGEDVLKYGIEGTYLISLSVDDSLPEEIKSEADNLIESSGKVYRLSSELKLNAKYSIKNKGEYTHEDVIRSVCYFLPYTESFAPIYAKTESDYTIVSGGKDSASLAAVKSFSEVKYFADNYDISSRSVQYAVPTAADEEQKDLEKETLTTNRYDYSFKTVADNAQLLFVIRNVKAEKDKTFVLPTVSPAYGTSTDLAIKNLQEFDEVATLLYNGAKFTGKIKLKELAYYVNSQNNTGSRQLVYIQKSEAKDDDNIVIYDRALPVRMVSPLSAYGSFTRLGSLVYILHSIENGNVSATYSNR